MYFRCDKKNIVDECLWQNGNMEQGHLRISDVLTCQILRWQDTAHRQSQISGTYKQSTYCWLFKISVLNFIATY